MGIKKESRTDNNKYGGEKRKNRAGGAPDRRKTAAESETGGNGRNAGNAGSSGRIGSGIDRRVSRLLWMVLVPALFAVVLLLFGRPGRTVGTGSAGKDGEPVLPAGTRSTGPVLDSAAGQQTSPELEAWMRSTEEYSEIEERIFRVTGTEAGTHEPIRKIAFTAGKDNSFQRSIPVKINADNIGGEQGTRCWAVFLPAEMAEHPHILFSEYSEVTLEPLQESERLNGAKLYQNGADKKGASAVSGIRTYSSGDEAEGSATEARFACT